MLTKQDRFKEFRSWYRKIPPPQLKSVFEGLWQTDVFNHSELVEMATDTLRVMDRAIDVEGGEVPETQNKVMLMPGFPCPLCRFPTYSWVEDLDTKVEGYVLDFIRENHPGWDVQYGACDRCVEVYKLRADGVTVDIDAGNPRALFREPERSRPTDSGASPGDDAYLARDSIAHRPRSSHPARSNGADTGKSC